MNQILPIKSSSRAGRFKKKLVTEGELLIEAPLIQAKLFPFLKLLSGADFTAAYLVIYLSHRFPGSWLGAKKDTQKIPGVPWKNLPFNFEPNIRKRLSGTESLNEIFANFALRSTPEAVNRAILEWSKGLYKLELMHRIPTPKEVLEQQIQGRRCVTALLDERISKYILGERDALSFTMHDLIHADHFYFHNECFKGQLGFYGLLNETFSYFDLSHRAFLGEFEYLISDMNAYAIHLMKCLKSAMVYYFDDSYFENWHKGLDAPKALALLNTSAYIPTTMDPEILSWLETFRFQR